MSPMGIAYHLEYNTQGTLSHHGFHLLICVECVQSIILECIVINMMYRGH